MNEKICLFAREQDANAYFEKEFLAYAYPRHDLGFLDKFPEGARFSAAFVRAKIDATFRGVI